LKQDFVRCSGVAEVLHSSFPQDKLDVAKVSQIQGLRAGKTASAVLLLAEISAWLWNRLALE